jgi:hypothetical protein
MVYKWLLIMLFILFGVVESLHAEFIGVFGDTHGCKCSLEDKVPGLMTITVLHVNSPRATRSRFAAPKTSCMSATWLGDTSIFPGTTGNSQTGISIDYGQCHTGTFHVFTIVYFSDGKTTDCCYYQVLPDPNAVSGRIEAVNCNKETVFIHGRSEFINVTDECGCNLDEPWCYPVAAESSIWGKIKALYKE